jgi:hypothetical protein
MAVIAQRIPAPGVDQVEKRGIASDQFRPHALHSVEERPRVALVPVKPLFHGIAPCKPLRPVLNLFADIGGVSLSAAGVERV